MEIQNLAESYLDPAKQNTDLIRNGVEGGTIRIAPCSQQTLVRKVGSEINRLLSSGLQTQDIAVISVRGRRAKNSIIHYHELGGHSVVPATEENAYSQIICDTFLRFKGLERPAIIVTDLRLVSDNYGKRMYFAISRALGTVSIVAAKETIERDPRLSRIIELFLKNVAVLMSNFLMTRSGPFRGVRYNRMEAKVVGEDKIGPCWKAAGKNMTELKEFIRSRPDSSYQRILIDMKIGDQRKVADDLWEIFKLLLPPCMGKSTLGLVAASKMLFSVFPEVALPVDNTQWRAVFKTVDYGDIIMHMAEEIAWWEKKTAQHLERCLPDDLEVMTLPAIYNVMAMKARSR